MLLFSVVLTAAATAGLMALAQRDRPPPEPLEQSGEFASHFGQEGMVGFPEPFGSPPYVRLRNTRHTAVTDVSPTGFRWRNRGRDANSNILVLWTAAGVRPRRGPGGCALTELAEDGSQGLGRRLLSLRTLPTRGDMANVLVVDDPQVRGLVRDVLRRGGHLVQEAADGADALRVLGLLAVDLLVCDLFMPGKGGLEVIPEVRCRFPGVPVVAMSGGGFGGRLDLLPVAAKLGAARVLAKPFTRQALLTAVGRALESGSNHARPQEESAERG